ncbi:hypothetical protein DLM75_15735 [Leptospira stimsonii]|uniref:Uncharacterized protein n=1 Tax=Leptospira stimsonii TaxID=2202203 RepID=A0A396Z186_9LEPT|nr:hypothetical protein DLM75_15735 [Leptospira stimsonii]
MFSPISKTLRFNFLKLVHLLKSSSKNSETKNYLIITLESFSRSASSHFQKSGLDKTERAWSFLRMGLFFLRKIISP